QRRRTRRIGPFLGGGDRRPGGGHHRLSRGLESGGALVRPTSRGALLALAAVSAVTAAGCCRLFGDAGWVVPVFAAGGGAHAVGAVTRRWSGRAALAAHGAGLALLLPESVGGHTVYGVPTPATVTALGRTVGRAPEAL